jgi:hypothetical protein
VAQVLTVGSSNLSASVFPPAGNQRYASPRCMNLGDIDDPCRPGAVPFNTSIFYPNDYIVNLTNMYHVMCVCARGLECHQETLTCQDPEMLPLNVIR